MCETSFVGLSKIKRTVRGATRAALLVLNFLLAGCATSSLSKEELAIIARHPVMETRMATNEVNGYLPSGVWSINGRSNVVYLAGTCHVLPEDQIPFPSPYYAAYNKASEIYVEVDTTRMSFFANLRLTSKVLAWVKGHRNELVLPKGKTLSDYLSPKTLDELREAYGKDLGRERISPLMLLLMSEGGVMNPDETLNGVDDTFMLLAHRDRKPVHDLDDGSINDIVIVVFEEMFAKWRSEIEEKGADEVIAENLLGDDQDDNFMWRRGDLSAVEREQQEIKRDAPALYEKGIVERNHKWLPKLKRALAGKKDIMILVGVDHMGGPDGLIELLKAEGFQPQQMYGVDKPGVAQNLASRKYPQREYSGHF